MSRSLKNTLWASGANAAQQLIAFLAVVVTARFVAPSAFGTVAVIMVFVLVAQRVMVESVGYFVMNKSEVSDQNLNAAFLTSVLIGTGSSALITAAAISLISEDGDFSVLYPILVLSAVPVIDSISNVQFALFRRNGDFKAIAGRTFIANLVSAVTAVVLAYSGYGIWSLVAQQLVLSLIGSAVLFFRSEWRPNLSFDFLEVKSIVKYGLPMSGSAIMQVVSARSDLLFAGALIGAQGAGLYSVAKRLVRTVIDTLITGAMHVVLSDLNRRRVAGEALEDLFLSRLRYGAIATFPLFGILSILSADIVLLLLGDGWSAASPALSVLAWMGPFQFVYLLSSNVLISHSLAGRMIGINVLSVLALAAVVSIQATASEVSLIGIAFAVVFQSVVVCGLAFLQAKPLIGCMVKSAAKAVAPAVVMMVAVCFSVTVVGKYVNRDLDVMLRLLVDSGAALFAYLLTIPIFLRSETRMVLRMLTLRNRR
jgi:O-antigen/teichoic acid export membrane protein